MAAVAAALAPGTASAAGLIAAYERYQPGKGFEIGLINAQTGAAITLPAGVNTTADELHPALSRDGRLLVFERMTLLPNLSGDFLPPEQRTMHRLDRQTGVVTQIGSGKIAGPAFIRGTVPSSPGTFSDSLSWGYRPIFENGTRALVSQHKPIASDGSMNGTIFNRSDVASAGSAIIEATHGAVDGSPDLAPNVPPGRDRLMLTLAYIDETTGALLKSVAHLGLYIRQGNTLLTNKQEFGSAESPASHPMPRTGDLTVAFAMAAAGNFDIQTTTLPKTGTFSVPQPTAAPAAINTAAAEQMPAWSPDDLRIGFVRTASGRRKLAVFNATPGIQAVLNPPADLGLEAPTPQTRSFQSVWGGLSLAETSEAVAPVINCGATCLGSLQNATTGTPVLLKPTLSLGSTVGILVVRVVGKRRLLGRTVPRIRVVGRVPLGRARKGINRLRWDGKVDGKRLKRGTYLLTYRSLKAERITNTSGSVRFTVGRGGKIRNVRRQR
jgi:hypothetical protein